MIFFFGTRTSKIKERKIGHTTCTNCETKDSYVVTSFSSYFHFFWIPIIPLSKTHTAECSHCKKAFVKNQFTEEMNTALQKANEVEPAKRPIWQGCGCLIISVFFLFTTGISLYGVYLRSKSDTSLNITQDKRLELLQSDIKRMTQLIQRKKDSLSFALKECIGYEIESGFDTEKVEYFTQINQAKILVLIGIKDIKDVKPENRKVIIEVIEYCLRENPSFEGITDYYIGVEGKWNTILVKTPTEEDLGGRFADKNKLLPFYGEKEIEQLNEN